MANLKDIRTRIHSVQSTKQVTSAMKMVSAAKLKKAQNEVAKVRPFEAKLSQIIGSLGSSVANVELNYPAFRNKTKNGITLVIAIASDKGLAGAFNSNVVKEVEAMVATSLSAQVAKGKVEVLALGKQVAKGLRSRKLNAPVNEAANFFDNLSLQTVYEVADTVRRRFETKELDKVIVVYNKFVNTAVQEVSQKQLLPLQLDEADAQSNAVSDFIVEPSKEEVLEDLIPQAVRIRLLALIKESLASEHGARMTAMHKATDNATTLLAELQLQYNKARQTAITNELIEIVSGASALNG
ncbi:MAG: ATP synthase F1 subunit gamma [Bacteroidales bacterium]|nr:ATP synthase F1 subunit gamma [Bacteroidales bacterium]MDD7725803.1 ATP synthase F1 subunit gamma [Bacteroidales bacterium]MDY4174731.1 ATP synthase F1 subunit gamma [Bacteroidales bacterium]